jgi:alanine racemase
VVQHDIVQTVYRKDTAQRLNESAERTGKTVEVFVKVDTGLHRVGVKHLDAPELVEYIEGLPNVNVKGIFSTFMQNPETDEIMRERLLWVDDKLKEKGIKIKYRSMSSSDAVFHNPEGWLDIVRPGMSLYGVYPEEKDVSSGLKLKQALSFKARIEHIKWVEEGDSVTYWGRFIAPKKMKIGTLHVGFYDGIPREMANKGTIKVGETYRRSLGSVSLNHYLFDLTDTDAKIGDVVEVIGIEGENSLAVTAKTAGWMVYSLLNHLNPLTPRVYYQNGEPIAIWENRKSVI